MDEEIKDNETVQKKTKKFFQIDKFSIGFFGIIVLFLIVTLTLSVEENIPMSNKDKSYIPELIKKLDITAKKEQDKNIQEIDAFIESGVHNAFQSVYRNIPRYVDTQYTWYRDYISMYKVAKDKAHKWWKIWKYFVLTELYKEDVPPPIFETKSYAEKSSNEIQQVLFSNGQFDRQLEQLYLGTNHKMKELLLGSKKALMKAVSTQEKDLHEENLKQVQELSASIQETFISAKNDLSKIAKARKAGTIGLSLILTKTITAKILAKSGVKVIAKSGGFWAGAATGITVCAPSGPWALACGAVVGTVTWVGVDFAVSKADEAITREAFERKLILAIKKMEKEYTLAMQSAFRQGIDSTYIQLDKKMHLRPIDMVE